MEPLQIFRHAPPLQLVEVEDGKAQGGVEVEIVEYGLDVHDGWRFFEALFLVPQGRRVQQIDVSGVEPLLDADEVCRCGADVFAEMASGEAKCGEALQCELVLAVLVQKAGT